MRCPHCEQHDSKVLKTERPLGEDISRTFPLGTLKRRRRECKTCERTFFTFEVHEERFRRMLTLTESARPAPRRTLRTKLRPGE